MGSLKKVTKTIQPVKKTGNKSTTNQAKAELDQFRQKITKAQELGLGALMTSKAQVQSEIKYEKRLIQATLDFFFEPCTLSICGSNEKLAHDIADKMLWGEYPALHITAPKIVGETVEITRVSILEK